MIPAGVAAIQARISAIESRFTSIEQPEKATAVDFDRVLASAKAGFNTTRRLSPHTDHGHAHHVHTKGAAGPPAELAAYGNGKIPAAALEPIGVGNHRLWAPAAANFRAMADAAAREGIAIDVTDSYRSLDAQHDLARRKGIYGRGGLAAVPGTSNHGWGRSLDLDTSAGTVQWLRENASTFGFFEDVPGEPWHWTYRPAAA